MAPTTLQRNEEAWLDRHADEWIAAGLISEGQADAIMAYEHVGEPAPPQQLTIVAEVAAYLGSVLAIMGGAVVVGQRWDDMGVLERLGIGVAIALIGFASGAWLMRLREDGASRLGSYLWALGTAGVVMAVAVAVDEADPADPGWMPLIIGIFVAPIGLGLWRNRQRPLQFLTAAAGFACIVGGVGALTDADVWWGGVLFMIAGTCVAVGAAIERVAPRLVALVTGSFGAYIGGFMLGDYNRHLGPAVAAVVAAVVVFAALRSRTIPLLVIGVIGALIATEALLATTFTGTVSSMIVALIGLAIVVVAMMRTRRPPVADS